MCIYFRKEDLVVSAPFYSWTAVGGNINIGGIVYVYLNGPEVIQLSMCF